MLEKNLVDRSVKGDRFLRFFPSGELRPQEDPPMATDHHAATLADLVLELRDDADVLSQAVDAARAAGRPGKALPEDEVRRHIHSLLDAIVAMLRGDPDRIQQAAIEADELADDRVRQGVSMQVLLDGVQSARSVLVTAMIHTAQKLMSADDLLPLLIRLDSAANLLQNRMVVRYQETEQQLGRTRRHTQVEALRELLGGGPVSWAHEAALDLKAAYHCIVVNVSAPSESRRIEPLIDAGDGVSGIVHGYLCGISTRYPDRELLDDVLVVASPLVSVDRLATTYELCREALTMYRSQGRTGIWPLAEAGLAVATSARPALGQLLAEEYLRDLDPHEDFHRLLATTALTYITEGKRNEPTAAALHIHPNTVKYRIRRFAELVGVEEEAEVFGRALPGTVNWWWALTVWLGQPRDSDPARPKT